MNRLFKGLIIAIAALLVVCSCAACSQTTDIKAAEKVSDVFTKEEAVATLTEFLGSGETSRRDRTAFSEGEKAAAQYIYTTLESYGYESGKTLETQEISTELTAKYGSETKTLTSRNVIATYNEGKTKTVVIGANYDNLYADIEDVGVSGDGGEGVLCNATGVSALLNLARAFKEKAPTLDFSVKFAFFGACEVGAFGSGKFVSDYLKGGASVLLAVNLYALAGEKIEVYADETQTVHEQLFVKSGGAYETTIEKLSSSTPLFPQRYANNLSYSHVGLLSSHVSFFENDIPSIALFGGESDGLSYTSYKADSLESFRSDYDGYAQTITDVSSLVYGVVTSGEFSAVSFSFGTDKYDYSFFTNRMIAALMLLGAVIVLGAVLMLVVAKLNKSKPNVDGGKKVKIAVFGMDYEEKTDNVIYVDLLPEDNTKAGGDDSLNPFD